MSQVAESRRLSIFSILMISLSALCFVASFALAVLQNMFGLTLIYTGAYWYLPMGAVAFLVIWGIYGIAHKCRSGAMKIGLSLLVGLAAAIAFIFAYTMIEVYLTYSGEKYAVIESQTGDRSAVVMQGYYFDEERLIARYGENYSDKAQPEDMMRDFHAYRMVGGFFMDTEEGTDAVEHIYIGEDSEGRLMYEWIDENTLRFYIENPAEDDRGEIAITFE